MCIYPKSTRLSLWQVVNALDSNPTARRTQLQHKFEQVIALVEDNIYECSSEAWTPANPNASSTGPEPMKTLPLYGYNTFRWSNLYQEVIQEKRKKKKDRHLNWKLESRQKPFPVPCWSLFLLWLACESFFFLIDMQSKKHIMPVNKTGIDGISLDVVLGGCLNVDLWNQEFLWLLRTDPTLGKSQWCTGLYSKNFHSNIYSFVYDFYSIISMCEEAVMGTVLLTGAAQRLLQSVVIKSGVFSVYFLVPSLEGWVRMKTSDLVPCTM